MTNEGWKGSNRRRDRLQIIAQILDITKYDSLKTQIMYKANLSFAQLNEYLSLLLEMNLVETRTTTGKTFYRITPKGVEFLNSYKQIKDLLLKEDNNNETLSKSLVRTRFAFFI